MISQFSIFKKTDLTTKEINYIINTGDIHNILPKFNEAQSEVMKNIIATSSDSCLFLFEYPFNLNFDNESIKKCRDAAVLSLAKLHNPVFLLDFTELYGKSGRTIDYRLNTFIFNIFNNLLQDFINSKNTGERALTISFGDISKLMISTFDKVQADYNEIKQLIEQSSEMPSSRKILLEVYVDYFEKNNSAFQESKHFAEDIACIQEEVIEYLIMKFSEYKNCEIDFVVNGLINNNLDLAKEFGYHAGQHYIQKIGLSFSNTIELNVLKEIINNPTMPKIFLFTGALHANNINELLIKCGYEKVYENISTPAEIINKLVAKGINVVSEEVSGFMPVPAELLNKLSEPELSKELFDLELAKIDNTKNQVPFSWMRRVGNFFKSII